MPDPVAWSPILGKVYSGEDWNLKVLEMLEGREGIRKVRIIMVKFEGFRD